DRHARQLRLRAHAQRGHHRAVRPGGGRDTRHNRRVNPNSTAKHPKRLRKTLRPVDSLPKQAGATCCERRGDRLKLLKAILIVAVLATALSFGACAQRKETVTTSAGTTGYAK